MSYDDGSNLSFFLTWFVYLPIICASAYVLCKKIGPHIPKVIREFF